MNGSSFSPFVLYFSPFVFICHLMIYFQFVCSVLFFCLSNAFLTYFSILPGAILVFCLPLSIFLYVSCLFVVLLLSFRHFFRLVSMLCMSSSLSLSLSLSFTRQKKIAQNMCNSLSFRASIMRRYVSPCLGMS